MPSAFAALPYPPSANRLWRVFQGRSIKSAAYRAWLVEARSQISDDQRGIVRGRHVLNITVQRPDNRARDLDNLLKPTLDAIKDEALLKGLIRDDADTQAITIRWADAAPSKDAKVIVWATEEEAQ